ncbi:MAG TPA: hypothetical protein DCS93_32315 [Microscillaceae bacterium]|nr:hypothetical protein [Microscillaceae bacterium]
MNYNILHYSKNYLTNTRLFIFYWLFGSLLLGYTPLLAQSSYQAIIDAGSSGTRIYLYEITSKSQEKLPQIQSIFEYKLVPGLSDLINTPALAKQQVKVLLDLARCSLAKTSYASKVPLHLLATAGLRLKNQQKVQQMFQAIQQHVAQDAHFTLKKALVLSGRYEGLYAWLATNYLSNRFASPREQFALIEMGGASLQVAYALRKSSPQLAQKYLLRRKIKGQDYTIYSRSYLGLGQNIAYDSLKSCQACFVPGPGATNYEKCLKQVQDNLNKSYKMDAPQVLHRQDQLMTVSSFYYTFKSINLLDKNGQTTLNQFVRKGKKVYAQGRDAFLKGGNHYLKNHYLNLVYMPYLLRRFFQLRPTRKLTAYLKKDGKQLTPDWTLGAVLDIYLGNVPEKYK